MYRRMDPAVVCRSLHRLQLENFHVRGYIKLYGASLFLEYGGLFNNNLHILKELILPCTVMHASYRVLEYLTKLFSLSCIRKYLSLILLIVQNDYPLYIYAS